MPTVQSGARTTADVLEDAIVQEMMKRVAQLQPSAQPLTTLMNHMEKAMSCRNPDPQHMEDELLPNIDLVSGAHTAADTTIAIDNPLFYLVGDILHVPRTGENMRVTAAPGTSPVTVVRGVGAPAAALVDDEPIWILGGAQREGDTSRTALNTLEVVQTERCQIVRNSIESAETEMATEMFGGDFEDQFEKKLIEHKRQLDLLFKYSTKSRTDTGSGYLRTMEGLLPWIRTNVMDVGGVLGEGEWDAFLEMAGQFGSDTKCAIVSPRVWRAINNFAKNRLVTVPMDGMYGLQIREYVGPINVWIVVDRELKGTTYSGYCILVDPEYLLIRYLMAGPGQASSPKYQGNQYCRRVTHIQANDSATRKDEIYSQLTLQKIHERTAAVLRGVEG